MLYVMVDFAGEKPVFRTNFLERCRRPVTDIETSLNGLRARIRDCEKRYGRVPGSVSLLPVSKGQPPEKIEQAWRLGIRDFGESYLQEAEARMALARDRNWRCNWHFIGPLQSNKTRGIAANFQWVQSVERIKIARRLSDQRPAGLPPLNVCVQVNLSGEVSKSGVGLAGTEDLCREIAALPRLRLRGLMAIPAQLADESAQREAFRALAIEFHRIREFFPEMDTLSMGMSADFEAAIAEGATMIRLGEAIFGKRLHR